MFRGFLHPPYCRLLLLRLALRKNSTTVKGNPLDKHYQYKGTFITKVQVTLAQISQVEDVLLYFSDAASTLLSENPTNLTRLFSEVLILARDNIREPRTPMDSSRSWFLSQIPWLIGLALRLDSSLPCKYAQSSDDSIEYFRNEMKNSSILIGWISACLICNGDENTTWYPVASTSSYQDPKVFWSNFFEQNLQSIAIHKKLCSALDGLMKTDLSVQRSQSQHRRMISVFHQNIRELLMCCLSQYRSHDTSFQCNSIYQCTPNTPSVITADLLVTLAASTLCLAANACCIGDLIQEEGDLIVKRKREQNVKLQLLMNLSISLWCAAVMDLSVSTTIRRRLMSLLEKFNTGHFYDVHWRKKANQTMSLYTRYLECVVYESASFQTAKPFFKLDPKLQVRWKSER